MEKASRIFATLGFIFLLMQVCTYAVCAALFLIPAILQSYDESITQTMRVLAVIFGVLAGLSLIALPFSIVGKNKLYDAPGDGTFPLIFSGVLSLNVFLILAAIFGLRVPKQPEA